MNLSMQLMQLCKEQLDIKLTYATYATMQLYETMQLYATMQLMQQDFDDILNLY
jgi:hypothetical protein